MAAGSFGWNWPRMASIQMLRGTWNTRGAAFTNHSAASPAPLAMACSRVSAQCMNVNTARCAFTNLPTGLQRSRPASYSSMSARRVSSGESKVVASMPTPSSPAIAKAEATTETLVKDGQTLVLGGIYTIVKSERESRVPYLWRIPILGRAFMSREVTDSRKELLIFVTPRIVKSPQLAGMN